MEGEYVMDQFPSKGVSFSFEFLAEGTPKTAGSFNAHVLLRSMMVWPLVVNPHSDDVAIGSPSEDDPTICFVDQTRNIELRHDSRMRAWRIP